MSEPTRDQMQELERLAVRMSRDSRWKMTEAAFRLGLRLGACRDYRQATAEERAMARGFITLWESVGVQDADDWLYTLRNRAELLASLDEDDCREAQDNTPSLGPFKS